jgi:hypothetical protein
MRKLAARDWLVFVAAGPFVGGLYGCAALQWLTGRGHAHDDMFALAAAALWGGLIGLLVGPALVWRRWKRQSPF